MADRPAYSLIDPAPKAWPAAGAARTFFPRSAALVTAARAGRSVLALVEGPSIVNRFPFIVALSLPAPARARGGSPAEILAGLLEEGAETAVQFATPGPIGHPTPSPSRGITTEAPVLDDAYLVYEARLARPGRDFGGNAILRSPTRDVAGRRIYFLEITAIQLQRDIAEGRRQIHWQSLPDWEPGDAVGFLPGGARDPAEVSRYIKGYTAHYRFPSPNTTAFEWDTIERGRAVKLLPALPEDQVEVDDDRARWPCFFPSSLGLVTTWAEEDRPNLMPCGSTTVVSQDPLILAPCVSYAPINRRYAPRRTLDAIRRSGTFGCGVAFVDDRMLAAIRYAGNVSFAQDPAKVTHAGLDVAGERWAPRLLAAPLHHECEVIDEIPLGTHVMFLGAVRRTVQRADLTERNPLRWSPWGRPGPTPGPA